MITLATPWAVVRGPAGSTVDVYCGEDVRADGSAETQPRQFAMRYILRGDGGGAVESYEAVGFRYLSIVARGGAQIESAGAIERRYPRGDDAYFECDDPALNKIWRVGARTLELCSTDAFIDCPGREQRAWLGDSYIHALLTYVDQHRLAPGAPPSANLRAFAARRRTARDGRGVRFLDFVDHDPRLLAALDSRARALLRIFRRRRDGARADADRGRRAVRRSSVIAHPTD